MAIWGKILGAAAGLAVGGPLGALVGGIAGHAYDKIQGDRGTTGDEPSLAKQTTFAIAVVVLSAKMATMGKIQDLSDMRFNLFQGLPHEYEGAKTALLLPETTSSSLCQFE